MSDNDNFTTIYFVGYARLPDYLPIKQQYDRVAIGLEVDIASGLIVASSSTILTELGRRIVMECLNGKNVKTDMDLMVELIKRRFQGDAQKALLVALKNAVEKYQTYQEGLPGR